MELKRNLIGVAMIAAGLSLVACSSSSGGGGSKSSCKDDCLVDLLPDMAGLDKAHVPALFFSNIGNSNDVITVPTDGVAEGARATINVYENQWDGFSVTHAESLRWGSDMDLVSADITTAKNAYTGATSGTDVSTGHPALENIRDTMANVRSTSKVDYLIDDITEAHHAMEAVLAVYTNYQAAMTAAGSDAEAIAAAESTLITDLDLPLSEFNKAWDGFTKNMSDHLTSMADDFGMSADKIDSIATLDSVTGELSGGMVYNLDNIINNLEDQLSSGAADVDVLATNLGNLKPAFVKFFIAYGDFLAPFEADMIAMEQAFIPAIYCTNNPGDAETRLGSGVTITGTCVDANDDSLQGTLDYLDTLETKFQAFTANYPQLGPVDARTLDLPAMLGWTDEFTAMQADIDSAQATVQNAITNQLNLADVSSAHDDMESFRDSIYQLRAYEQYAFVMDRMTDYHDTFSPMVAIVVTDSTGKILKTSLTEDEVTTLQNSMPGLESAFATMRAAIEGMNHADFGFTVQADIDELNASLDAQESHLAILQTALDAYNAANDINSGDIAQKTNVVKANFVNTFKLFGNF